MDNVSKMSKPHYNVLIAAPAKNFEPAFVESLVKTCAWLNEQGLTYKFLTKSSSLIMSGRELTALDLHHNDWETREVGAGQFTYDKIFWIDSDIEWDVEQFQKIWESDLDIVGGLSLVLSLTRMGYLRKFASQIFSCSTNQSKSMDLALALLP
jgi:hypothetical protein